MLFDAVDRWKIAEKFGIDNVHAKTRLDIYERVAAGRPCSDFQQVLKDIAACEDGLLQNDEFVYVDWSAFTEDLTDASGALASSLRPLAETQRWLREIIARHCPFVSPSLNHGRLWLSAIPAHRSRGELLQVALHEARQAFLSIDQASDSAKILNAMVLAVPVVPGLPSYPGAMSQHMKSTVQDFGDEYGTDVATIGSFVPAEPTSATADPRRTAPAVFVFRHAVTRSATHKNKFVLTERTSAGPT